MNINPKAEIKFNTTALVAYVRGLNVQHADEIIGFSLYPARPHDAVKRYTVLMAKNGTAWAVGRTAQGDRLAWKTVKISKPFHRDQYRMRSVPGGYRGDAVKRWSRTINGKKIDFVRIAWNMGHDGVTVRAEDAKTNKIIHEFHYAPKSK